MKEIRTLLSPGECHSFDLYGMVPPAHNTHEEAEALRARNRRRRKPNRVSERFQAIRDIAERHAMGRRTTA